MEGASGPPAAASGRESWCASRMAPQLSRVPAGVAPSNQEFSCGKAIKPDSGPAVTMRHQGPPEATPDHKKVGCATQRLALRHQGLKPDSTQQDSAGHYPALDPHPQPRVARQVRSVAAPLPRSAAVVDHSEQLLGRYQPCVQESEAGQAARPASTLLDADYPSLSGRLLSRLDSPAGSVAAQTSRSDLIPNAGPESAGGHHRLGQGMEGASGPPAAASGRESWSGSSPSLWGSLPPINPCGKAIQPPIRALPRRPPTTKRRFTPFIRGKT